MPVLSKFYGIIIRMYFQQEEHNPPHIHALYGDDIAAVSIHSANILEGHLPPKAFAMVGNGYIFIKKNYYKYGRHRSSKNCLPWNKEMIECFIK